MRVGVWIHSEIVWHIHISESNSMQESSESIVKCLCILVSRSLT